MESPLAYIPVDRRLALAHRAGLPDRTDGAALFADLSGFTALAEAMVRALGPQRGAEELPRQLNLIYDALIAELDRYGGSVIGFSGDAITCWFEGDSALRATAAAFAMQRTMAQFAAVAIPGDGIIALTIKVSVAAGSARRLLVGDPAIQIVDVLAGATLDRLARGEELARKGEVVVGPEAAARLGARAIVAEWRTDEEAGQRFAVLDGLAGEVAPSPWAAPAGEALAEIDARPWLLPPVWERLHSGLGEFLTELRPAVALFVRFGGIDYDADADAGRKLDAYIRWVQGILTRYDGFLIQLTHGDKGSYLYAAFGAPLAHDDDATRAVAAALELRALPPELAFIHPVQMGLSAGRMRTGAYGSATRRTYGVLGDEVNLAARLMQEAPAGQIWVSPSAHKQAAGGFRWATLPPMLLKGKTEPVTVFRLLGTQARPVARVQEQRYSTPMVGREAELELVDNLLVQVRAGQGRVLAITGEAGMGKSRVVAETIRQAVGRRLRVAIGECQSYGTNNSYLVWAPIWRSLLDLDAMAAPDEQIRRLESRLAALDATLLPRLPLLGFLLGLPIPDNELTRSLDAKLRKASLEALLVNCLRALAASGPLALVLEDCQWLDPLSDDLLEAIGRVVDELPVLLVLTYRPPVAGQEPPGVVHLAHATAIRLTDLTSAEAAQLIAFKLAEHDGSAGELPAAAVERITVRAQGNPFYIEELLNYVRDRGLDPYDLGSLDQLELPSSLHSLILSRIDRLTEQQKIAIKVASVVGRIFSVTWLGGAHPELRAELRVKADLDALARLDLTPPDRAGGEGRYLFKHILTREVTYESLPFAMRATLHGRLGQFIEQHYRDTLDQYVALLAHHYGLSEREAKKREYLRKAGEAAQAAYANSAAVDYYRRLLPLLRGDDPATAAERREIHARLGELLANTGQYDAALDHLRQALQIAGQAADAEALALACRWIGRVHELRGEYGPALYWIRKGLEALGTRESNAAAELPAMAALIYTRQGNYEQALEQVGASLRLAERLANPAALAFAYNVRASIANARGNSAGAADDARSALALYEQAGDIPGQGRALNIIANANVNQGEWAQADRHFRRAREIFTQTGDVYNQAVVDNNLGTVALNQGRLPDAVRFFDEGLRALAQIGGSQFIIGVLEMNLGAAFSRQGTPAAAQAHLHAAQECFAQTRARGFLPELQRHFAEAALAGGDLPAAAEAAGQALALAQELAARGEEGNTRRVLGEIAAAQGDPAGAAAHLTASLTMLEEGGEAYELARSQLALAQVYAATGQAAQSRALLAACTATFTRLDAALDLAAAEALAQTLAPVGAAPAAD